MVAPDGTVSMIERREAVERYAGLAGNRRIGAPPRPPSPASLVAGVAARHVGEIASVRRSAFRRRRPRPVASVRRFGPPGDSLEPSTTPDPDPGGGAFTNRGGRADRAVRFACEGPVVAINEDGGSCTAHRLDLDNSGTRRRDVSRSRPVVASDGPTACVLAAGVVSGHPLRLPTACHHERG